MDRASIQERFGIVGSSDAIKNVIDRARQVAQTDISVLLQGESGVGKELIAQVVHELSMRRHEDMVVVNCGAIPEGLIESELFGAEKGAYTGAVEKRTGYFEEADDTTIFLDEIGEMPKAAQVRLLRVLETGKFSRVGSSTQQESDVRVVAATNKDLAKEVEKGNFRKDLYYRLSTVLIDIPPLRERREDILPIFESFLHRFAKDYESVRKKLTDDAEELLESYHWPGNVRELRNVAEQAVVLLRQEEVDADDLRPYLRDVTEGESTSTDLMRVDPREQAEGEEGVRERELLYRAILEMRMEMRDIKDQIGSLMSNIGIVVPRGLAERADFPGDFDDFVIVQGRGSPSAGQGGYGGGRRQQSGDAGDYGSLIKDVVYEVEHSEPPASEGASAQPTNGASRSPQDADEEDDEPEELPTLEDAEKQLISRALKRFDGNRRKTARALGISERTLYRKLKDIDEDL
jgi:transcriptional regulator with PAS, ATPase and Fis domain